MIGTSFLDFVVIRSAIFAIRSITPISIVYCLALPFIPKLSLPLKIISIYPICETAFYFFVYLPRRRYLQQAAEHPPLPPPSERRALLERILRTIPNYDEYFRKWFLNAELEDVKRENLKEFLRWSVFNTSGSKSEEMGGLEEEEELDEYIGMVEKQLGRKLEEGRGKAECYRLTVDEVKMKHRPLFWYLIIGSLDILSFIRLSIHGYTFYHTPVNTIFQTFPIRLETFFTRNTSPVRTIPYWLRPHKSATKKPILYIHGIGIGLHPYVPTLAKLAKSAPDVGIIVVEIAPISARICKPMLKKHEMVREIRSILDYHGYNEFVLAANSYGTVISTHLLHDPEVSKRISEVVLVDPVTILLHLPDVAYNFLRRVPRRANEHMLHYFASTDPMIAHTLCRRFFWAENILWLEDLAGRKVTVYLGGRDLIVNTWSVRKYLTGTLHNGSSANGVVTGSQDEEDGFDVEFVDCEWSCQDEEGGKLKVVWCAELDHASIFDINSWYTRLVGTIVDNASN